MKTYTYRDLSPEDIAGICARPKLDFSSVSDVVNPIIDAVEKEGDAAVIRYTHKFDGVEPDPLVIDPQQQEITLPEHVKRAIDQAYDNIKIFHEAQLPEALQVETMPGVVCRRETRPIENVGLYVPGGTAKLPSTALMLAIPAMLCGCKNIVLATPPDKDGKIAPEIIYIAQKTGVAGIMISGGAQAIAAMAHGTQSVPKVDKIFGPGNQYVTAAKMILQNSDALVAMDLPAGPSEVLVIADEQASPVFVAADLLSQAEHGADSQVGLVVTTDFPLDELHEELDRQLAELPREKIAQAALENSFVVVVDTLDQAFDFSNQYAPEHLIVNTKDAETHTGKIQHAGSVFLGPWTPESVGDYASGTNHTLPTYGYARMYSGVSVDSFLKQITFQQLSRDGLQQISSAVQTLADLEGLEAHKQAVAKRVIEIRES